MIELNLKSSEGHAAFMKLVATADVIIENMRATVKHRLKIAWDDVHASQSAAGVWQHQRLRPDRALQCARPAWIRSRKGWAG